jgi:ATP-dependent RNA helicase DeaD
VASFADLRLSETTLTALAEMGITSPTPIQAKTLPALLDGRDVVGQARTGSGKTLAFAIPAVEMIDPRQRVIQVLVLTPTRELAVQVGGVMESIGRAKGVKVGLIYGGRAIGPQREMLRRGVQAVVGTPGRVLDLLSQGAMRLDKVRFLVLDEADQMLDSGFAPDVERILSRATPDRQTALFSATVPDWVRETSAKQLNVPVGVAVDPNPEDAAPIEHVAYDVLDGDKMSALRDLLDHRGDGSIIVFGRTKHGVKKLARLLSRDGYPVAALQGNLSQNARDQVMADFRAGAVPILLATNVAARGLDVTHVSQVINIELPESSDLLTHRIGRTGRMGRRGQAITLLSADDGTKWRQLERGLGRRIPRAAWRGAKAALSGDPLPMTEPVSNGQSNGKRPPRPAVSADAPSRSIQGPSRRTRSRGPRSQPRSADGQHQIVCTSCGQPAVVPFQPDPTRPVYCSNCFRTRGRATRPSDATALQR